MAESPVHSTIVGSVTGPTCADLTIAVQTRASMVSSLMMSPITTVISVSCRHAAGRPAGFRSCSLDGCHLSRPKGRHYTRPHLLELEGLRSPAAEQKKSTDAIS